MADRFESLLVEHKGILWKVASVYCARPEDRNDLMQEIAIQLWRSFDRFDDRCRFSTWMYRIAINVAISFYRSESRRTRDAQPLEGLEFADPTPPSEEMQTLHQLIAQLDEWSRALVLLYLDGYSHDEIAFTLGITATNAATRLSRIKQKLKELHGTR